MNESSLRETICALGASLFARRLTFGSSGNISARLEDGWLMTPINVSLGALDLAQLSRLDGQGTLVSGDPPTKESVLHRVMYEERPRGLGRPSGLSHPGITRSCSRITGR